MFVAVKELVGIAGMPVTTKGIRQALEKAAKGSSSLCRKREGSKAFEYHIDCLPAETREAVLARHYNSVLADVKSPVKPVINAKCAVGHNESLALMRQCPALLEQQTAQLNDKQRAIADARCALVNEVLRLESAGMSRIKAIHFLCTQISSSSLPVALQAHADAANAKKGSRVGISARSLNGWVVDYCRAADGAERLALLAPGHRKPVKPEQIGWFPLFLAHWRNLNGPSLTAAYSSFCDEWEEIYADQPAMIAACPSYMSVRRAMNKLPRREKARGRLTGSAAKALETYVKRDWSTMPVNGCWIADGKSLNMKVAHPIHGRPFTPELTNPYGRLVRA